MSYRPYTVFRSIIYWSNPAHCTVFINSRIICRSYTFQCLLAPLHRTPVNTWPPYADVLSSQPHSHNALFAGTIWLHSASPWELTVSRPVKKLSMSCSYRISAIMLIYWRPLLFSALSQMNPSPFIPSGYLPSEPPLTILHAFLLPTMRPTVSTHLLLLLHLITCIMSGRQHI